MTPLPCHKCGTLPEQASGLYMCPDCEDCDLVGDPPQYVSREIRASTVAEWNERTREAGEAGS